MYDYCAQSYNIWPNRNWLPTTPPPTGSPLTWYATSGAPERFYHSRISQSLNVFTMWNNIHPYLTWTLLQFIIKIAKNKFQTFWLTICQLTRGNTSKKIFGFTSVGGFWEVETVMLLTKRDKKSISRNMSYKTFQKYYHKKLTVGNIIQ